MTQSTITVQFNGQTIDLPSGTTIERLLQLAEMQGQALAVEVNLDIVPRDEHATRSLCDGDCVEAVTLVGGG